ncbi:MAG: type I pantothenate kinase [Bacillaceae bacterium]|nr:type I pantothenate kinase [Bacillaceae bacterium]
MYQHRSDLQHSPFISYTRDEWAELSGNIRAPITKEEFEALKGINERISLEEVSKIYLPLSRLLNLYVTEKQTLHQETNQFFRRNHRKVPFVIGIAGSVAVGKSTTARLIQTLLSRWPNHPKVDLVTTDGFLYPNQILKERNMMNRKGFPESYRTGKLIQFLAKIKAGAPRVEAPVYSHLYYDVLPSKKQIVDRPDVLIVEGINVLQVGKSKSSRQLPSVFVSDFFDFSIYVDANEEDIQRWYVERFMILRETAFKNPNSYFHRYSKLTDQGAVDKATEIWNEINRKNLVENIYPTKNRADLILTKGKDHSVSKIKLRRV